MVRGVLTLGLVGCVLTATSLASGHSGWLTSPDAADQASPVQPSRSPASSTGPATPSRSPAASTGPATPSRSPASSTGPTTPSRSPAASTGTTTPKTRTTAAPMIVIDPGHSGRRITTRTASGLRDVDYPNFPEIYETWDISTCVAQALRTDGYRVTLTKQHALSSVSLADRAAIANRAKAALAVSVHDDHGQSSTFQATYSQRGVAQAGRYPAMYRGDGSDRTVFDHPTVARQSESAATKIATARTEAQRQRVTVQQNSFSGRAPLEPGNLALVQLLTDVPWVYNEAGARTGRSATTAMTISNETGYAAGLLAGIEASVPLATGRARPTSATGLRSCLVAQIGAAGDLSRPTRYLPYGWG